MVLSLLLVTLTETVTLVMGEGSPDTLRLAIRSLVAAGPSAEGAAVPARRGGRGMGRFPLTCVGRHCSEVRGAGDTTRSPSWPRYLTRQQKLRRVTPRRLRYGRRTTRRGDSLEPD